MTELHRRLFLEAVVLAAAAAAPAARATPSGFAPPQAFTLGSLKRQAAALAQEPYAAPPSPPEAIESLDYQAWGDIRFKTDHALFKDGPLPVTFFHLGKFFPLPVRIFAVDDGRAREVLYSQTDFDMPPNSPARALPQGAGFAGFRVQEPRGGALDWRTHDWVAFLGGCYFRAIGALHQYGLSARGVAIDTAVFQHPEEFPRFSRIYLERPAVGVRTLSLYALLEGPSLTGAFRFEMTRGEGVTMKVEQSLYLRRDVSRFGLAPLTSMFWFSETIKQTAVDWRPEVHDSDGLAIWTGQGERLWRPLNDPQEIAVSAFADENPRGFGLMQRDRTFDHYLDGVFYDRRPSLWVEPLQPWGRGSVQLIELPTSDETNDNIVAAWVPDKPAKRGDQIDLRYRLYWLADEPYPSPLARCVATRIGRGGQPGLPRPPNVRKFVVEFQGGPLTNLPFGQGPQMDLHASRGHVTDYQIIEAVPDGRSGHWRVEFDLAGVEGPQPVELSLKLFVAKRLASETWLYQHRPAALSA